MANPNHEKSLWQRWLALANRICERNRPLDMSQLGRREIVGAIGVTLSFGASYAMGDTAKYLGLSAPGGYAIATVVLGLIATFVWVNRLRD